MKKLIIDKYIFFLLPFFAAIIAALYLVFSLQFVYPDALSRSFHSYAVFFANDPRFANIGFVWPPFPTLISLPLAAIKPLNLYGFVGNLMSALFLSISCVFLNRIFNFFNLGLILRIGLILLFILNPMILLYGANGMSEIIAIAFFVATIFYFLSYLKSGNIGYIIGTSLAASIAVMTRYEMAALIPMIMIVLIVNKVRKFKKLNRKLFPLIERDLLLFGVPVVFVVALWIFANWAIMHNPFYFVNSIYSNTSQSSQLVDTSSYYKDISHNISASFNYVIQRVIILFPAFLLFAAILITKIMRRQTWIFVLAVLSLPLSLLLFHMFLLFSGQSFGWLRFFIYIIPSSFILCAFILSYYRDSKFYKLLVGLSVVLILLSGISSYLTMSNVNFGKEEHRAVRAVTTQNTNGLEDYSYAKNLEIANYLNSNIKGDKILVDDFTGFSIVYLSGNSNMFVETIDTDFKEVLSNVKTDDRVQYLLVHRHGGLGDLDAVNIMYPTMFENGANFAVLVKDFGTWRLYKKINSKA